MRLQKIKYKKYIGCILHFVQSIFFHMYTVERFWVLLHMLNIDFSGVLLQVHLELLLRLKLQ